MFEQITAGTCGKDNTACVAPLARTWKREFDQILDEIEALRHGRPTAIRLVNAANAFNDPSASAATLRGFEAYFEALTVALCDNAKAHEVVCVDVRPVLNGPDFEQPVDDSSQESMDAVAELLEGTGAPELEWATSDADARPLRSCRCGASPGEPAPRSHPRPAANDA
jgi:hypothetical protein